MHISALCILAVRIYQRLPLAPSRLEARGARVLRVDALQFAVNGFDTVARVKVCPFVGRKGPTRGF
jgi:hypothetical protein